jgi:hypothetical protein
MDFYSHESICSFLRRGDCQRCLSKSTKPTKGEQGRASNPSSNIEEQTSMGSSKGFRKPYNVTMDLRCKAFI